MNVTLDPDVIEILQQCLPDGSSDINSTIRTICDDLSNSTHLLNKIDQMYDELKSENSALEEKVIKYNNILNSIIHDLNHKKDNQSSLINEYDDPSNQIALIESAIKDLLNERSNNIQNKLASFSKAVSDLFVRNIDNLAQIKKKLESRKSINSTVRLDQDIEKLSQTLNCSPSDVSSTVVRICQDNNKYHQMLETIVQILGCKNDEVLQSINSLIAVMPVVKKLMDELNCNENEIEGILKNLLNENNQMKSVLTSLLKDLKCNDITEIKNHLSELIKKNENDKLLLNQIESLKQENDKLKFEKGKVIERFSPITPKVKLSNLSYATYGFLFSIPPKIRPQQISSEDYEQQLRIKDEAITSLSSQMQDILKSMNESQNINLSEFKKMELDLYNAQVDKLNCENTILRLKREVNELKVKLQSMPQSELLKSLCNLLGCKNEDEIKNKIYDMKEQILSLNIKNTSYALRHEEISKSNDNSNESGNQVFELNQKLNEASSQISNLQQQINSLENEKYQISQDNESLKRQLSIVENSKQSNFLDESNELKIQKLQDEVNFSTEKIKEMKKKVERIDDFANSLSLKINNFSNTHQDKSQLCDALQYIFLQFTIDSFSEESINSLIKYLEQLDSSSSIKRETLNRINQNSQILMKRIDKKINRINNLYNQMSQKINNLSDSFSHVKQEVLEIISDQRDELNDFRENDYAVPYASLLANYKKLKSDFENLSRIKQGPTHIQATPPKASSHDSRFLSVNSPSEIVLDNVIHQNYKKIRFHP